MTIKKEQIPPVEQRTACPAHPGEILKELYIDGLGMTQEEFSLYNSINNIKVSDLISKKISCTMPMASRLSEATNTTPELWLNLQANYDKWMRCKG